MEMPPEVHIELWTAGPERLVSQSRYAAMLVSMHGRRLYERRDRSAMSPAQAEAVTAFLERRRAFETEMLVSLGAPPEQVQRNSDLIWTWDSMSLALCLDWSPHAVPRVPTADGEVELALVPTDERRCVLADPWPFASPSVTVRCEGRRLERGIRTEHELREAFAAAPWETVEFALAPL
jgi:hypothetical protein